MKTHLYRILLGKWNLLLLLAVVAAATILAAIYYYRNEERLIRKERYNELKAIADLKTQQIIQWRTIRIHDASVAYSKFFGAGIALYASGNTSGEMTSNIINRLEQYETLYGYQRAFLTDTTGKLMLTSDSSHTLVNKQTLSNILLVRDLKRIICSDVYFDSIQNQPIIEVVAPVLSKDVVVAYMILQMDPAKDLFPMIQSWPTPSRSAETVLLKKDGDEILFINELRHKKNTALTLRIPMADTTVAGVQAIIGKRGICEATDYRKVLVFSDLREIPGTNWYMVTKVDKKEMLAELHSKARLISWMVIGILLLLTAGLSLIFSYRQRNIYRELFKAEKELSETEEEFRTTLYSIGDAVIICDNDQKVMNMNPVAESLTGWKESDGRGKMLDQILQLKYEKSNEDSSRIISTLLHEKGVTEKNRYITLISNQQIAIPIAVSSAEIISSNQKKSGNILVFRDQTSEREAENRLRYSEELFSKLFQLGAFPTVLVRFADDIYLDVNNSMLEVTGYSKDEIIGKTSAEIGLWKDPGLIPVFKQKLINEKIVEKFEIIFISKAGEEFNGLLYSRLVEIHGELFIISRLLDITEQKRSERALRESEEHYRSLFESMLNGYAYCKIIYTETNQLDFEILNVNNAFISLTGFADYKGRRISDLIPEIQTTDANVFGKLEELISSKKPIKFEYYLHSLDQWYLVMAYNQDPEHFVIIFDVITDQKKSEIALTESEQRYRSTLDNMMEGCQILDREWRYVYINQKAAEFGRLNYADMIGKKVTDFFPDFESTEMYQVLQHCMTERIMIHREFSFIFPGNRMAWFDFSIQPVPEGIFILSLDITDKRSNQEVIESQYTMLSALINSAKEIDILSVDTQYRYTAFNEYHKLQIKNLTGLDIKLGDNILEIIPAPLVAITKQTIDKALSGKTFSVIEQNESFDKFQDYHLNPIRSNEQIIGATIFIRDITDQVLSESELLEAKYKAELSEKQYRLLAERMVDVIWVIDTDTLKFKYVSPSVEILRGYTPEEVLNQSLKDVLSADSYESTMQDFNRAIERFRQGDHSEPSTVREMNLTTKDGSNIWTEVASSLVMNEDNVIELVGIARDITERKKVENELRENEVRFRMLLELVPYPLAYVDNQGIISFRNQKFIEKMGYTDAEIPDLTTWWETAYPDPIYRQSNLEYWTQAVAKASLNKTAVAATEVIIQCKNGEKKVFEVSGIDYADGFLATFIDITERKQAENLERLGHEVLKELNENKNTVTLIPALVTIIKKHSGIEAVGIRLKEGDDFPYAGSVGFETNFINHERYLCNYDKKTGEVLKNPDGEILLECMCGNILQGRIDNSQAYYTNGGSFQSNNSTELLESTSDTDQLKRTRNYCNSIGYESVALIPIRSGSEILGLIQLNDHKTQVFKEGIIPFFEGLGTNIGLAIMRNKVQEELIQINTQLDKRVKDRTLQLEEANKELESFSYSVSHDLRAPLRHISGFSQILSNEYGEQLPEKAGHYLKTINQSVKTMGNLIDDLLQFSRTGRTDLKKSAFDMNIIVTEVIHTSSDNYTGNPVTWEIANLPVVFGDHNLIKLVWINLISNALKYSKDKSQIEIQIGVTEEELEYVFFIKDNGIGFDMKYVQKLFGVFQRLHSSDHFEGTGIGLANVRRIVSRHGGRTWAESIPDQGASFYFSIPKN